MMNRLTVTGLCSLVALVPVAIAGCRAESAAPTDVAFSINGNGVVASVHGSGNVRRADGTYRVFTLTAARRADGTVTGSYNLEIAGQDTPIRVKGDITCLVVDGSSAYIGGDVDRFDANPFPTFPGGMAVEIIDNGEGGSASADLLSSAFFTQTQQEVLDYCADPAPGPVFPIEEGNFRVR